jgi:four helix bundle protein
MNKKELEDRTKRFALRIIAFVQTLPRNRIGDIVTYQLVKAGTSVGANYREANRAESRADFIHKLCVVTKEAAEAKFWLELCDEAHLGNQEQCRWLLRESCELLAVFTSAVKTSKAGQRAHVYRKAR